MLSVIYASILAILIVWLSLNVTKKRRNYHISIGDENNKELTTAIAAQSNAVIKPKGAYIRNVNHHIYNNWFSSS